MERFQLTDSDKNLIEIALEVIHKNFDNKFYNHTVGCALLCKKLAKHARLPNSAGLLRSHRLTVSEHGGTWASL